MPKVLVKKQDGTEDPPYYGFYGIDQVIQKYGEKHG
jgi:hypothetical protein